MPNITENILFYNAHRDETGVLDPWLKTIGQEWPIDPSRFRRVLAGPEPQHFVVRERRKSAKM
jgi:hypothetical protein